MFLVYVTNMFRGVIVSSLDEVQVLLLQIFPQQPYTHAHHISITENKASLSRRVSVLQELNPIA